MVTVMAHHEAAAIGEPYIVFGFFRFEQLSWEIAIEDNLSVVNAANFEMVREIFGSIYNDLLICILLPSFW